jgi:hypothetical protein
MNDSPNLPTGPASPLYLKLTRTELLNKATNPKRARHRG